MATVPSVPSFTSGETPSIAVLSQLAYAVSFLNVLPALYLNFATGQNISNSTSTALTWGTPLTDRDSGWSASHPTRYTAQTPGYYDFSALAQWATGSGDRQAWFQVTTGSNNPGGAGNTTVFGGIGGAAGTAPAWTLGAQSPYLYVLDYVEVYVSQNSGGTLATGGCYVQASLNGLGP